MPFSCHCVRRIAWDMQCPTIHGSAGRFLHPSEDRPLTVREMSLLMGWPDGMTPRGYNPVGQIAKGVCPEVGVWLAEQVQLYLDDEWGDEDYESSYDDLAGQWVGRRCDPGQTEKVFDLTKYAPAKVEKMEVLP